MDGINLLTETVKSGNFLLTMYLNLYIVIAIIVEQNLQKIISGINLVKEKQKMML